MSLARRYKRQEAGATVDDDAYGEWEPWPGAADQIQAAYDSAVVSHKPKRKVSGQFVEETLYGKINDPDNDTLYARRRDLSSGLTRNQMRQVADDAVKQALVNDLRRRGLDPEAAKVTFDPKAWPTMPDGTEIHSVRCHANLPSNIVLKPESEPKTSQTPAGNQVGIVFRNRVTGNLRIDIITRLDAFRQRQQTPREWAKPHAKPDEDVEFTIGIGEMLQLAEPNSGDTQILVVKKLSRAQSCVYLAQTNDSSGESEYFPAGKLLRWAPMTKVLVTPAGLIRTATD
jgi:CRISPR-associated endonuclease Csn1